ncbi:MAG: right-handed parallel beta-helix repeat-containing protein [Bacteroides sp.]|nr:right-handed parallel beta-helix repeat-containing protein [Bacteroides sp.]MCM1095213.1 right-handed parallel beta-helix repeat-containing protein [Terasakiella sp.]
MKKTHLLVAAAILAAATPAQAAKWFVKSDAAAGGDGKTWETAFNLIDCITAMPTMTKGDDVYFAGGTYTYPELQASGKALVTGLKMQDNPVNLYGSYPAGLTGTDTPELTFPSANPTILNGDRNGNGVPDEGDMRNLIFIQTTTKSPDLLAADQKITIRGFVLTCAYYAGTKATEYGAINADMTHVVTIRDCTFRNNKCENAGAAYSNSGSQTHFIDCVFEDNVGQSAGQALNQSKRGNSDSYFKPMSTIERCLMAGNRAVGEGKVAGGSAIRMTAGTCYIINSTITGNSGYKQGAIHLNEGSELYIASSTIADNEEKMADTGSAIYSTGSPKIRIINSYILGMQNDESVPAIRIDDMTGKVSASVTSDGGNVLGLCSFNAAAEGGDAFDNNFEKDVIIAGYDEYSAANTPYAIFGRATLQDKGGFSKVLEPKEFKRFYNKSDFAGLFTAEYKCPVEVNDLVDQRGVERPAVIAVGAYDTSADAGIADAGADGCGSAALTLNPLGGGLYALGAEAASIAVYDLGGRRCATGAGSIIDLSMLAPGMYIVVADGAACKIVK